MSERCDEKLFTIKQVLIPLTDAPWAVVQVPVPMTEENWEELECFLALIKKPVTYHPSPLEDKSVTHGSLKEKRDSELSR